MKNLPQIIGAVLLLAGLTTLAPTAHAQVSVNVQVGAPAWGPPVPVGAQYYYIPEIDGYYDLYNRVYVYFDPYYNTWVSSPGLPPAYAAYDPRFFHPVVVQYVGAQPWGLIYDHRAYSTARGWQPGYYRSAPAPRWQGGYASGGYRPQPAYRAERPYATSPGRQGYGNAPNGGGRNNANWGGNGAGHDNGRGNDRGNGQGGRRGR